MKLLKLLPLLFLGSLLQAQVVAGSITANNQCVSIDAGSFGAVGIEITGTFSATLQPEVAIGGQAAKNTQVLASTSSGGSGSAANTITSAGIYTANIAGATLFQICSTSYASGSALVYLYGSKNTPPGAGGAAGGSNATIVGPLGSSASASSVAVVVASDQGAIAENLTQFGGVAVNTGTGASGTGTPRVTVANDSQVKVWDGTNQATVKAAATNASAAADTSLVVQILAQGLSPCNGFFGGNVYTTVSGTTSGTSAVQIVALSAGKKIWVCSTLFTSTSGTTPTISLVYGTGSNCATGQTVLMPAMALSATASTPINIVGTFVTASANELCYLQTGTTPVASYSITYAQL